MGGFLDWTQFNKGIEESELHILIFQSCGPGENLHPGVVGWGILPYGPRKNEVI